MTRLLPVLSLALATMPFAAHAQQSALPTPPPPPGLENAELLPGWQRADGSRVAALEISLAPGWKTYWRTPGDAGIPPRVDFSGSRNVAAVRLHWPAPEIFTSAGMRTIGYHDGVLLPVSITPADPAKPVVLKAEAMIGICDRICVPVTLRLDAELSGKGAPDPRIEQALAAEPKSVDARTHCQTEPVRDGVKVTARIDLPPAIGPEETLFELASKPVWVSEATSHREGDVLVASADFVPPEAQPFDLDLSDVRITVLSDRGPVQIKGCDD